MQSYQQFKTQILERLRVVFPDADIRVHPVTKTNNTVLEGLMVMAPGSNISPTLYLEQLYDSYRQSGDFEQVWGALYGIYREYVGMHTFDTELLHDFSAVRQFLCCRLINAQRNAGLLENAPHMPYLDLAVVYYISFPVSEETRAGIPVTRDQAADWNVGEDRMFDIALENMRRDCPPELIPLSELLSENGSSLICEGDAPALCILTNRWKHYGASALLNPDVLQDFCEQAGDFYILPSSLHEVLLVPQSHAPSPAALNEIIRDVNRSHLDPQDFLSDHCYVYSSRSRRVEQAF